MDEDPILEAFVTDKFVCDFRLKFPKDSPKEWWVKKTFYHPTRQIANSTIFTSEEMSVSVGLEGWPFLIELTLLHLDTNKFITYGAVDFIKARVFARKDYILIVANSCGVSTDVASHMISFLR